MAHGDCESDGSSVVLWIMVVKRERKRHLYKDCTGFPWQYSDSERNASLVNDLCCVTCGQCKGRITDALRATDWSTLPTVALGFLSELAMGAK